MHKSIFYHIILILSLPFFSCAGKSGNGQSNKIFEVYKIIIISPYGCFQEIEITSKGIGIFKSGLKNGNIMDEDVGMDSLINTDSFHIQKEEHLKKINNYITSLLDSSYKRGGAKHDAYRYKFSIDGVSKIDQTGYSKNVYEILNLLINYLPLSNDKCEFFELFKKSMHRSD